MANLKKNFFFSALLTLANYIFPLITYPYVSRVLGVTNIGICNFVDSIINYFLVFSTMGISVLGVREIAAAREDRKERSRVFSNLLFLNAFTTLIATLVLLVSIFVVPSWAPYRKLLLVGVAKLLANSLFLALGMLKWYETSKSEQARYAPILLLPVDIVRRTGKSYVIRKRDEDIFLNITLVELLKQNFGINLDVLKELPKDESGVDVKLIFTYFRRAIIEQKKWNVIEESVLGLFSFNNFLPDFSNFLTSSTMMPAIMSGMSTPSSDCVLMQLLPRSCSHLPLT